MDGINKASTNLLALLIVLCFAPNWLFAAFVLVFGIEKSYSQYPHGLLLLRFPVGASPAQGRGGAKYMEVDTACIRGYDRVFLDGSWDLGLGSCLGSL